MAVIRHKKMRIAVKRGVSWSDYIRSSFLDLDKVQTWCKGLTGFRFGYVYQVHEDKTETRLIYFDKHKIEKAR